MEVTDARSSIHRLKRLASVDQEAGRLRQTSLASSEGGSQGELGSQGSSLQDIGHGHRGS
jgi:hypothetical protein